MGLLDNLQTANTTANDTLSANQGGINNALGALGETTSLSNGDFFTAIGNFFSGTNADQLGINLDRIPDMKSAIQAYVDAVNEILNKLETISASEAFGQKVGDAIGDFVKSIKAICAAITSNLLAFKDDLEAIKTSYETQGANVTSTVQNTSSEVTTASSTYTFNNGSN